MFRPIAIAGLVPILLAATVASAQDQCVRCEGGAGGEPVFLPAPAIRSSTIQTVSPEGAPVLLPPTAQNNGNGRGGGNRGNGKGSGGANGGGGNDGGGETPPDDSIGCGTGQGGGSGNGGKGAGNGVACGDGTVPALSIQNEIDFGRLILLGSGASSVLLDLATGEKITAGNLDDYGGVSMVGRATVTGRPHSQVNVIFPDRITMRDPRGGIAELREFATNLPRVARLDGAGRLEFTFSGRLALTDTIGEGGNLRGQVPITVEYN